jgi:hypothetical protein
VCGFGEQIPFHVYILFMVSFLHAVCGEHVQAPHLIFLRVRIIDVGRGAARIQDFNEVISSFCLRTAPV